MKETLKALVLPLHQSYYSFAVKRLYRIRRHVSLYLFCIRSMVDKSHIVLFMLHLLIGEADLEMKFVNSMFF
jgi:hypothetical protein